MFLSYVAFYKSGFFQPQSRRERGDHVEKLASDSVTPVLCA